MVELFFVRIEFSKHKYLDMYLSFENGEKFMDEWSVLCRGLILKVQQFTYLLVRFMILFQNTGGVINNN